MPGLQVPKMINPVGFLSTDDFVALFFSGTWSSGRFHGQAKIGRAGKKGLWRK
jgi:hypothetical protein